MQLRKELHDKWAIKTISRHDPERIYLDKTIRQKMLKYNHANIRRQNKECTRYRWRVFLPSHMPKNWENVSLYWKKNIEEM